MRRLSINAAIPILAMAATLVLPGNGEVTEAQILAIERSVEAAFNSITEDSKPDEINKILPKIYKVNERAFPVLARHLDSEKVAPPYFQGAKVSIDPKTGELSFVSQDMGDVALMMIRSQVLGRTPKAHRVYEPLGGKKATKLWLESRRGKSLLDLQIEATKEALVAAEQDNKLAPSIHTKRAIEHFTTRLGKLEKKPVGNETPSGEQGAGGKRE